MKKELQDLAWSVLPNGNKVYCRNMYRTSHDGNVIDLLERLYGRHNLTSDAEGEEVLTISRKELQKHYADVENDITDYQGNGMFGLGIADPTLCERAKGMKAMLHRLFGSKCLPDKSRSIPLNQDKSRNSNLSQDPANCDKHFDNILKDSFAQEHRLNIAAMMMQGLLANPNNNANLSETVADALNCADALLHEAEKGGKDE